MVHLVPISLTEPPRPIWPTSMFPNTSVAYLLSLSDSRHGFKPPFCKSQSLLQIPGLLAS
uniref:Uncharacterized protein n=1 Tax=Arundo donax TaxID=35708 RepID=A0A0A9B8I6_ARUDO